VTVVYADTSAIVGAYLADEVEHEALSALIFDGADAVVTSELTRVEFASALAAARRAGGLDQVSDVANRFALDCGDEGPLSLLRLDPGVVLPMAHDLVCRHRLRTLDAIHLAVALTSATALADEVVVLTRDAQQVEAAQELGLSTR
jgi:uncharacterized protein